MAETPARGFAASLRRWSPALHLVAVGILLLETVYWLAQPCTGDFLCEPIVGVFTAMGLIPLVLALAVWRARGRVGAVVVVDALLLGVSAPQFLPFVTSLRDVEPAALLLLGLPLVLAPGVAGALRDLRGRTGESLVVLVLLGGVAFWLRGSGAPFAVAPLVLALAVVVVGLGGTRGGRHAADSDPLLPES
jgi:hypothetical protein